MSSGGGRGFLSEGEKKKNGGRWWLGVDAMVADGGAVVVDGDGSGG